MKTKLSHCRTYRGNVIIMSKAIQRKSTIFSIKGENWKLTSEYIHIYWYQRIERPIPGDIGGSLALYVGFTFMSIVETVAFFVSKRLRKVIVKDNQTLIERKNPPIKFPCRSQKILNRVSLLRQRIKNIKSRTNG